VAKSQEEIAKLLQQTKFKRKLFGGVDEEDVWKKLERLQAEYSELLDENSRRQNEMTEQWHNYAVFLEKHFQSKERLQSVSDTHESIS
jgi:predicted nuclease with TOPRIM domain